VDQRTVGRDGAGVHRSKRLAHHRGRRVTPRRSRRANGGARVVGLPRLVVNVVGAGLWLTGALWLLFHYLLKRQGWLCGGDWGVGLPPPVAFGGVVGLGVLRGTQ